jgi:hypothetical protein
MFLLFAGGAWAVDVDECLSTAGLSCAQMKITICPAGDFEYIAAGCGGTGGYLWIVARDHNGNPVRGIPRTDYWLDACAPGQRLFLSGESIIADSNSGSNGRTTFSGRIAGGGCTLTQGIRVAVQGKTIMRYDQCIAPLCLNIVIKGPDLTGAGGRPDGVVDLLDLATFGLSFRKGSGNPDFNPCCDFDDDNWCALGDFAFFRQHYQHRNH